MLPEIKVYADKAMISTVLRNLISNAIKFTHTGGVIQIATELSTDDVMVSVKDNGVGISKENVSKLFHIDENQSTRGTPKRKRDWFGFNSL